MPLILKDALKLGVATASTQIEGGDKNNTWYDWAQKGKIKDKTSPFLANSHWKNYKEHIDLMSKLNIQIYRFSLEWSRIEPEEGKFSSEAMKHYIDEINYLKDKGIEPLVTLHHFSNPIWFEKNGGFKNKQYSIMCFSRYVLFVVQHLKDIVTDFCTINEPNVYAVNCFLFKEWLNEESNIFTTFKVMRNMSLCHIEAYHIIHQNIKNAKVGIALHICVFKPENPKNIFDRLGAWFFDRGFNLSLLYAMGYGQYIFPLGIKRKTGEFFDYMGINYYTSNVIHNFKKKEPQNCSYNDLGWAITPQGFRETLIRFHRLTNKIIYVTENGTPDKKDAFRKQFIYDHLKALSDLSYVTKYYYWTFMDNFEWKEGQTPCFGLVEYHYNDESYSIRESATMYQEIIIKHQVDQEMMKKYSLEEYSND